MTLPVRKIAVIGLGYVGLPLAIAFAKHFDVVGFDIKLGRINALRHCDDATGEVPAEDLASTKATFTNEPDAMRGSDLFVITVPTPVTHDNQPDLAAVRAACATVGQVLAKGATIVLESTMYPGVTEEICATVLENHSGLRHGMDFAVGYSPERVNPGDRTHSLSQITKVVAGDCAATAELLASVYAKVTDGNVFVARDIRTAEAAKVIENAQRDINIAFMNEISMIFGRMGISVYEVLDAARTKWNFLPFVPGLVGGHCIGVDPFYLSYKAQQLGLDPEVILAGRRINDGMAHYIADRIDKLVPPRARVLVLGLAFKENVPDLRNSKVVDLVAQLRHLGHSVDVHDPVVDREEAVTEYGIHLVGNLATLSGYHAVIGAVPHRQYVELAPADLSRLLVPHGLLADVKGIWRSVGLPSAYRRWLL
jgi:UDP-N-acetyl-D-galactosamine dehydrogenase